MYTYFLRAPLLFSLFLKRPNKTSVVTLIRESSRRQANVLLLLTFDSWWGFGSSALGVRECRPKIGFESLALLTVIALFGFYNR